MSTNDKERAQALRERAAAVASTAERSDDRTAHEKEMAEARKLRAEADRLDPRQNVRKPSVRMQLCILCQSVGADQGWKPLSNIGLREPMALCPECEDATAQEMRVAGRRLIHAADRIDGIAMPVYLNPENIEASVREALAERQAS